MGKVIDKTILLQLESKRKSLLKELRRIDEAIYAIKGDDTPRIQWAANALQCLKRFDEFSRTIDILHCLLHDNLSVLEDPIKKKYYTSALSLALNNLCDDGVLVKQGYAGVKGYFYGFPEWTKSGMSEDLKPKYRDKLLERIHGRVAV